MANEQDDDRKEPGFTDGVDHGAEPRRATDWRVPTAPRRVFQSGDDRFRAAPDRFEQRDRAVVDRDNLPAFDDAPPNDAGADPTHAGPIRADEMGADPDWPREERFQSHPHHDHIGDGYPQDAAPEHEFANRPMTDGVRAKSGSMSAEEREEERRRAQMEAAAAEEREEQIRAAQAAAAAEMAEREQVEREAFITDNTLGSLLIGARMTAGLNDLKMIERELRIKARYLKAIEELDLPGLPKEAYLAGYVRSYARYLRDYLPLNPEEAYQKFRAELEAKITQIEGDTAAAVPVERPARAREAGPEYAPPPRESLETEAQDIETFEEHAEAAPDIASEAVVFEADTEQPPRSDERPPVDAAPNESVLEAPAEPASRRAADGFESVSAARARILRDSGLGGEQPKPNPAAQPVSSRASKPSFGEGARVARSATSRSAAPAAPPRRDGVGRTLKREEMAERAAAIRAALKARKRMEAGGAPREAIRRPGFQAPQESIMSRVAPIATAFTALAVVAGLSYGVWSLLTAAQRVAVDGSTPTLTVIEQRDPLEAAVGVSRPSADDYDPSGSAAPKTDSFTEQLERAVVPETSPDGAFDPRIAGAQQIFVLYESAAAGQAQGAETQPAGATTFALSAAAPVMLTVRDASGADVYRGVLKPGDIVPLDSSLGKYQIGLGDMAAVMVIVGDRVVGPIDAAGGPNWIEFGLDEALALPEDAAMSAAWRAEQASGAE